MFDQHLIFAFRSLLGILLFLQHMVLILHIKYMPECYMLYIAVWLLYNYRTSLHPLSYELDTLCHMSTPVVWSLPYFENEFINDLLELFSSLFNQFSKDLTMSSCFSIFHCTYCQLHVCAYCNIWFFSLYPHCPLFCSVTVRSILQVFLVIFRPPL